MVRRLVRALAMIIALTSVIAFIAFARQGYDAMSLPGRPFPPATPAGEFQDVSFPARGQNYLVRAFYLPASQPDAPALIDAHGYRGSRHDPIHLQRAMLVRGQGYNVLAVDLSDNGGDTIGNGRISLGYSERWDVLGAFDYLLAKGFAPNRIGLVGESMGGSTSLLAAALEPRIRAVWADSAYGRADSVLSEWAGKVGWPPIFVLGGMAWGVLISSDHIWEAAPLDAGPALHANQQAIYLIHCEPDAVVAFHHSTDLYGAYKRAGVNMTFWDVPDGEHASALTNHRTEYLQRLDDFFKAHLMR